MRSFDELTKFQSMKRGPKGSPPLCGPYLQAAKSVSNFDGRQWHLVSSGPDFWRDRSEDRMLDLLYLAIGIGVFVLFVAYAVALRRI